VASPASLGEREVAIVDLAIVRCRQFHRLESTGLSGPRGRLQRCSAEAAAASAAATALEKLHPQSAADFKSALDDYVKGLSASTTTWQRGYSSANGSHFGSSTPVLPMAPRGRYLSPRTQPGAYVPTATMVAATWPTLHVFVLERPDQFRPGPPVPLASAEMGVRLQ